MWLQPWVLFRPLPHAQLPGKCGMTVALFVLVTRILGAQKSNWQLLVNKSPGAPHRGRWFKTERKGVRHSLSKATVETESHQQTKGTTPAISVAASAL